jgi:hypothetical protein
MRVQQWLVGALGLMAGCSGGNGSTPPVGGNEISDATVSALARADAGWTYYKNRPDTLLRSAASGHAEARLRTRFNARAATQLDASCKVRANADFPDSSLIVKELIVGGVLNRYAVMMKLRGSANASAGGWLWAYYSPSGAAQIGIGGRGAACAFCHSAGIDFTRMNDAHP